MISNYDVLKDLTKEELIELVIKLDKLVEQSKTTIKTSVKLTNKLLKECGMEDIKLKY